jgi:hypothetical protein
MFWQTTHEDLDKKIRSLESKIQSAPSWFDYDFNKISEAIDLSKEIQEDFKSNIKYPTKAERDQAWQKFFNLRENLYRIKREASEAKSNEHYREINGYLKDADYWYSMDKLFDVFTFDLMKTSKEGMKWKGQQLREAGNLLTKYKHEMTSEHKAEIHERIVSIRKEHDCFWERYRDYQNERQKIYEEKKKAWEEGQTRRENAKERIQANVEKNKESLRKAEDALERQKQHRSKLQDDISSAYSDGFRERAEGWLDECNDKISDIESSIDRIETWIQEGKDKLNSFS